MIIIITGGTHTGKTILAQRFLEKYHYPYLSVDHIKMGLIRSGYCSLAPESSWEELTAYLWPVVREIIKTAIENRQNLIIEGCYIPFIYQTDFTPDYLNEIRYLCLVFSERYIHTHYDAILKYACNIENRIQGNGISKEILLEENRANLDRCQEHGLDYALVDDHYEISWDPQFR